VSQPPDQRTSDLPVDERMAELRQLFFESASELVQKLNDEALLLEKAPGEAETARSLRRTVHTLKGDAAACGFHELSGLSHEFEDVLTLGDTSAAALVPEIALRAADLFGALLEAYQKGAELPSFESLRADIARLAKPAAAPGEALKSAATKKAASKKTRWSEYDQLRIASALAEGKLVQHVVVDVDPQCDMPIAARQMVQLALAELGEVLAIHPPESSRDPITRIETALASDKPVEQIRAKCNIPTIALSARVTPLRAADFAVSAAALREAPNPDAAAPKPSSPSELVEGGAAARMVETDSPRAEPAPAPAAGPDNVLRVDAERIDTVLNLVGELILAKSMLQQALLEFSQRFPKDPLRGKFADAMAFQARVLNDLQHSVMKVRMVPVDQLFRRFPRIVRDVGRLCGKEVELVVRGGQTDLDKSILDAIAEPLTHLVRNAIGHGLETAEERIQAGKRPRGTLRMGAYHQGNQVVIEISDDGAGINVEKVRQRALAQGLVKAQEAARLSESDTLELILQPGFSTAEEITQLSGRGVGLDVVQSVLNHLKGTIQIETERGVGTTFRMRLPLTLAIIRALMFRVERRLYALPLNAVAEIARTVEQDLRQVEHYEVLQLRNEVLPLLRLGAKPAPGPETAHRKLFVLVIHSGERKFGLVVDELVGEDELVIKALDNHSIPTDLVSGASILGDGRVVLILNMIALMDRFTKGRAQASGPRMAGLLSGVGQSLPLNAGGEKQAQASAGSRA
jgi:two-component system, chemotaxis family, sensor kinase CheA